jgi:hypothetical protein
MNFSDGVNALDLWHPAISFSSTGIGFRRIPTTGLDINGGAIISSATTIASGNHALVGLTVSGTKDWTGSTTTVGNYSGLVGWFQTSTITVNSGVQISSWANSVSTQTYMEQLTGAAQPFYYGASSTQAIAGFPVVQFGLPDQGNSRFLTIPSSITVSRTAFTMAFVGNWYKSDNSGGYGGIISDYSTNTFGFMTKYKDATKFNLTEIKSGGGFVNTSAIDITTGTPHIVIMQTNASSTVYSVDGIFESTAAPAAGSTDLNRTAVNSNIIMSAYVPEMMIFNVSLSTAQMQEVTKYMSAKYHIDLGNSVDQSADLQQWKNSSGVVVSSVTASGKISGMFNFTPNTLTQLQSLSTSPGDLGFCNNCLNPVCVATGTIHSFVTMTSSTTACN